MDEFIAWCGFVGGWFLFAGPIYQAATELREESFAAEEFERLVAAVPAEPMSGWWWLLPPVAYVISARHRKRREEAYLEEMSPVQQRQLLAFKTKAHGWLIVGFGAFLIAVKETWELRETYGWHIAVFWILVVVGALLAMLNTAARTARLRRVNEMLDERYPLGPSGDA